MSDYWLSPWPGTEAAMLLAIARLLLEWDAVDHDFVRRWVNWEDSLAAALPERAVTYESFIELLKETYAGYTLEFAAEESGVLPSRSRRWPRGIAEAGSRFASHTWRSAGSGNLGGWQVARCLWFLQVLTGSVGTRGGTSPNSLGQVQAGALEHAAAPQPLERAAVADRVPAVATTSCPSCSPTSSRRAGASSTSTSPGSTTRCGPTRTASPGSRC